MNLMVIADEPAMALWDYYNPDLTKDLDLILSCGDLRPEYLEFLVTMANCPLLYVKGNHDESYASRPPLGCIDIDDTVYDFHGLRILGLGGSMRYREGAGMYSEKEMSSRIRRMKRKITRKNGFDILLAHAPAKGYGDLKDLPHRGFSCFNDLIGSYRPAYMLYGHVHASYDAAFQREIIHPAGTRMINGSGYYRFQIGDDEYPGEGKTGSALYDLYVSLKKRSGKIMNVLQDQNEIY